MAKNDIDHIRTILEKLNRLDLFVKEIHFSSVFKDTILDSEWLLKKSFSPRGGAASYSLLYLIYRILNEVHPEKILEIGMGQTTKMIAQYSKYYGKKHVVVESDIDWINAFKSNNGDIIGDNTVFANLPTTMIQYDGESVRVYDRFESVVDDYDFIVIDGPFGGDMKKYSRIDVLLNAGMITENTIIIVDDFERVGEMNTVNAIIDKMKTMNKNMKRYVYHGMKQQVIIAHENKRFLGWL